MCSEIDLIPFDEETTAKLGRLGAYGQYCGYCNQQWIQYPGDYDIIRHTTETCTKNQLERLKSDVEDLLTRLGTVEFRIENPDWD